MSFPNVTVSILTESLEFPVGVESAVVNDDVDDEDEAFGAVLFTANDFATFPYTFLINSLSVTKIDTAKVSVTDFIISSFSFLFSIEDDDAEEGKGDKIEEDNEEEEEGNDDDDGKIEEEEEEEDKEVNEEGDKTEDEEIIDFLSISVASAPRSRIA